MGTRVEPFKNILVDIDGSAQTHPALDRALGLARRSGGRLTITEVLTVPSSALRPVPPDEEMVSQRRQQLTQTAHTMTGGLAESKLLVGRPEIVLIQEVLRSSHDLLVRSDERDATAPGPRPLGAVDLELLRKCPCPLLLVRDSGREQRPQIVGAVDASTEEASERALNEALVELTLLMAELEEGTAMLLHAWAPAGERMIRGRATDDEFAAYVEEIRQQRTADLARLTRSFEGRLSRVQVIQRQGQPEDVIPEFVTSRGIDLVVMGTVARSGFVRLLFGSTAERVLKKLPCSVLAVKPDGFVCPVSLTDV
jgi:universal stress protein E